MRQKMKSISGQRERFRATFSRTGTKKNYHGFPEITLLFDDVCRANNGKVITDHLWFNNTKAFQAVNLEAGDVVEFEARVTPYEKGYKGGREYVYKPVTIDYKLSRPTKVEKITSNGSSLV